MKATFRELVKGCFFVVNKLIFGTGVPDRCGSVIAIKVYI